MGLAIDARRCDLLQAKAWAAPPPFSPHRPALTHPAASPSLGRARETTRPDEPGKWQEARLETSMDLAPRKKAAISAFLLAHLAAVAVWNLPDCAIKGRFVGPSARYLLPLGLWQHWGMFAPHPAKATSTAGGGRRRQSGDHAPVCLPDDE